MFCEECGTKIIEGNAFCVYCGTRVGSRPVAHRQEAGRTHARRYIERRTQRRRHRLILFCAVMIAIGAFAEYIAWANTGERPGNRQFAQGEGYLNQGAYQKAVDAFTHSIGKGSTDVKVYLGLAEAYTGIGDTGGAIGILEKGLAAVPREDTPLLAGKLLRRYKDLLADGYYTTNTEALNDIAARYDVATCRLLAEAFSDFGDTERAIELLTECRDTIGAEKTDTAIEALRAKPGNTPGNISNESIVAQQGEWLYYTSNWDYVLYKSRTDAKEWTRLCDDVVTNVNLIGDQIYYRNWSDEGALYKIGTDGTGRQRIVYDSCYNLTVTDGWIYYYNESDCGYLYKVSTDGRDKTRLNSNPSHYPNLVGDWIYYTDLDNIYRIRTNGTGQTKIMECSNECGFLVVDGDWMYYYDGVDYGHICKVRTDGTEQTVLSGDLCEYFNVADGWIYYSNYSDGQKLYKMRTDGTGRTMLRDDACHEICIVEDWIYYGDEYYYYRVNYDGSGWQKVK